MKPVRIPASTEDTLHCGGSLVYDQAERQAVCDQVAEVGGANFKLARFLSTKVSGSAITFVNGEFIAA